MRSFVLGLLNVLAWIFEIISGILAIMLLLASFWSLLPGTKSHLVEGMGLKGNVSGNIFVIFLATFLVAIIMGATCWAVRSIRLVIRNLQRDVYFDQLNLDFLHSVLKSLTVIVIISVISACVTSFATMQLRMTTVFSLNLSSAIYSLIILCIVYVIYLVFEKGLKLQHQSNK